MMDHFVISAHLRVFMLKRIKTMRACCNNFFNLVIVQGFNIFLGCHLVQHLITDTSGKISCAFFLCAQNSKTDTCLLQDFDQAYRYFFASIIKRTSTADPEQIINIRIISHHFNVQPVCPVGTFVISYAPRVSIALKSFKGNIQLFGVSFRHQCLALSHGHDAGNMFNGHRTDFFTGPAGGTGPERIFFDHIANKLFFAVELDHLGFDFFVLF